MKTKKIIYATILLMIVVASCKKADLTDNNITVPVIGIVGIWECIYDTPTIEQGTVTWTYTFNEDGTYTNHTITVWASDGSIDDKTVTGTYSYNSSAEELTVNQVGQSPFTYDVESLTSTTLVLNTGYYYDFYFHKK